MAKTTRQLLGGACAGLLLLAVGCSGPATRTAAAGGAPSPSPSPSQSVGASASAGPSTAPARTSQPGGTTPSPAGTTAPAAPLVATGLAGTSLVDLTWVSSQDGWALAGRRCDQGTCPVIAHTTDGGAHWQALAHPAAVLPGANGVCTATSCVDSLRFATPTVGYLFGPALFMTTDGGRTWQRQAGPQVELLAAIAGTVFRLAYTQTGCPGPCSPRLQAAAPGSTSWRTLISPVHVPDRSDSADLVGTGSAYLLATYGGLAGPVSAQAVVYRSGDGGRTWHQGGDPCAQVRSGEQDLIALAAAPGGFVAGLCSPHGQPGEFVVTSSDAGLTWRLAGNLPGSAADLQLITAATPTRLAVATGTVSGSGAYPATLLTSADGGLHWQAAARDSQTITGPVPAWLGFETAQVGRWISAPHHLWTTRDGGRSWQESTFP